MHSAKKLVVVSVFNKVQFTSKQVICEVKVIKLLVKNIWEVILQFYKTQFYAFNHILQSLLANVCKNWLNNLKLAAGHESAESAEFSVVQVCALWTSFINTELTLKTNAERFPKSALFGFRGNFKFMTCFDAVWVLEDLFPLFEFLCRLLYFLFVLGSRKYAKLYCKFIMNIWTQQKVKVLKIMILKEVKIRRSAFSRQNKISGLCLLLWK